MKCPDARNAILLESSGEISSRQARRLHTHLADCAACRAWQADLRTLAQALPPAPNAPPFNPAWPRITPIHPPLRRSAAFPAALAAALLALLAGGWWGWSAWSTGRLERQRMARVDRLQEWTLLAAWVNGDERVDLDPADPANPDAAREALARQLQRFHDSPDDDDAEQPPYSFRDPSVQRSSNA